MSTHEPIKRTPLAAQRGAPDFRFKVSGMDCASCAKTIEKGVGELDGVLDVHVNFTAETLEGHGRVSADLLRERIEALGYGIAPDVGTAPRLAPAEPGVKGFLSHIWRNFETRIALIAGLVLLGSLPIVYSINSGSANSYFSMLHWAIVGVVGYPIAVKGLRSLLFASQITINLLMTAAAIGAVAIGASGEAATVVLLYTLGEALESFSAARSRESLQALLALRPETATVIVDHDDEDDDGDAHTHYVTRRVVELAIGDRVLVKPGERIAADGVIVDGESGIDESAITGESLPVTRVAGDTVSAGTINGDGTLVLEVSRDADDFTISQIAALVEQAQADRSPAERFIDRFAQWYTPAVVVLAALVAAVPPLVLGQPFLSVDGVTTGWFYRALALLIVACPCALIISIPVTVVSALTRLAGLGILVKGGAQLNELASAKVFAFDKTGTLTYGRPAVAGLRSRDCVHADASLEACEPCDDLVAIAAAVERGSQHPLAHAVIERAAARSLQHRYDRATGITSHAGRGITGTVNGKRITVGREELFEPTKTVTDLLAGYSNGGGSLMIVGDDERVLGYIEVADELRPETATALATLKSLDQSYRFVMLTGDRADVAQSIGKRLTQIDEIRAGLLPEQKLEAVRELERETGKVAMIGDGINDTPALAGAKLGIAMGGAGSHQAMEVADVVLMRDDLEQLPQAVSISRRTQRLIGENIALSLGLKLLFLGLAIPGLATLWMAVLADVGTTLLVTLNGMRMLRAR